MYMISVLLLIWGTREVDNSDVIPNRGGVGADQTNHHEHTSPGTQAGHVVHLQLVLL
jgi:hypothetical protein